MNGVKSCPGCGHEMTEEGDGSFPVLQCSNCFGTAIPFRSLSQFMQTQHALLIVQKTESATQVGKRICPECLKQMVSPQVTNRVGEYTLDSCKGCQIVWFDPGELSRAPQIPEVIDQRDFLISEFTFGSLLFTYDFLFTRRPHLRFGFSPAILLLHEYAANPFDPRFEKIKKDIEKARRRAKE